MAALFSPKTMQNPFQIKNEPTFCKVFTYLYLGVGVSLAIAYIVTGFFDSLHLATNILKFVLVVASFLYVFIYFWVRFLKDDGCRDRLFLWIALLFTLGADVFLLLVNDFYEVGVSLFIVAQIVHFLRGARHYYKKDRVYLAITIALRAVLCIVAPLLTIPLDMVSPTNILTMIYFPNLIMNFVDGVYIAVKVNRRLGLFLSVGFLLFIGCDICVGLSNVGLPLWNLIWIFYGPSQIVLALSLSRSEEKQ
ncbi:MAG: hypothetical protein K6B65_03150 [Bacilli bacterium]|nr:hypothetical protein [Bacilli bacterium]